MKFKNIKFKTELNIWPTGNQIWYQNANRHRLDGPAYILAGGYRGWYQNGINCRTNGPAIIYPDGTEYWWENGEWIK